MKPGICSRMRAPLFHFLDCHAGKFKSLSAQLIDGLPQAPRDQTDTYTHTQFKRPHPPSQVKQEPRYLAKVSGDRLKLIPGSHGIRQPNAFFLKMGDRRDPKFPTEYRT